MVARVQAQRGWAKSSRVGRSDARRSALSDGQRTPGCASRPGVLLKAISRQKPPTTSSNQSPPTTESRETRTPDHHPPVDGEASVAPPTRDLVAKWSNFARSWTA